MDSVKNFIDGFLGRRVCWNVRHNSRAYDIGSAVGCITLLVVLPGAVVFGAGFLAGRYL